MHLNMSICWYIPTRWVLYLMTDERFAAGTRELDTIFNFLSTASRIYFVTWTTELNRPSLSL